MKKSLLNMSHMLKNQENNYEPFILSQFCYFLRIKILSNYVALYDLGSINMLKQKNKKPKHIHIFSCRTGIMSVIMF